MAVRLLSHDVSDLCLGKPPLRSLPVSATVADALTALRRSADPYLTVWSPAPACIGKLTVVDVICFLCSDPHIADPSSVLASPVSAAIPKDRSDLVRRVESHISVLDALGVILDGAQNLVVPIRRSPIRNGKIEFCCLTQEDFVRFFLNSIGLFSPIAGLSVGSLGLIRSDPLTIHHRNAAVSAAPLLKRAVASGTAVAVVDDGGRLVGEISPTALAIGGAAGALAALSAGELIAYLDCGGRPHRDAVRAVKKRLEEKGLKGMLEFVEDEEEMDEDEIGAYSSSSSMNSSSSSDEESSSSSKGRRRRWKRTGSYSSRMGRRSEEAIVCRSESSLVAVMIQALAHRVSYVWVVEEDYELAGVVVFSDVLKVLRDHLSPSNCVE